MRARQLVLADAVERLVGFVLLSSGVAAFDWRLGLIVAGILLWASNVELPWRRS